MRLIRRAVAASLTVAVFAGLVQPADAAPAPPGVGMAAAAAGEPRPMPPDPYQEWDGKAGVPDTGDPRLRQLVADNAELAEDGEVRDAAKAALDGGRAAIMAFLNGGLNAAKARAAARKAETDRQNTAAIQPLRGTGGPYLRAEVDRVLAGSAIDRTQFVAYGKAIAEQRDAASTQSAQQRATENRTRVQMLVAVGGPEVKRTAQIALDAGDAAIEQFLATGYLAASKKDAEAREQVLADEEARQKAAEALSDLAKRSARANEARRVLLVEHGNGIRALQRSSNSLILAGNEARKAEQILAANTAGGQHPPDAFDLVKAEVARQLANARAAATDAQQAATRAQVQADILVETGLPYGAQWAQMALGMSQAARAAVSATETASHSIDAAAFTDQARNAQERAQRHAEQARKWRLHAESHARAAADLAEAARVQAEAAKDAAARTKAARQAAVARAMRGEAEVQEAIARGARDRAVAQDGIAAQAETNARTEEGKAAEARDRAYAAERDQRASDARAAALEAAAAAGRGTQHEAAANAAAAQARSEATTAASAAGAARNAANLATGAAAGARGAAMEANRAAARARAAAEEAAAAAARANAAANKAEAEAAATHAAAQRSHSAAATATANEAKAAEAAQNAVNLANRAASEAMQSLMSAERTKAESQAAAAEAVSAATQAGMALRSASAAKSSSAAITDPANTAITVVAPFTGQDIDADFVVLVAEQARAVGAEQAAAAERRAAEALEAARLAQEAADRAAGEVKPAFDAAAAAGRSSAAAARSAADAQKAAAQAAADGAAARAAAARANQADAQAREDARLARAAANAAANDAALAGRSAAAAEQEAAAANAAATKAENDAAAARGAATRAETLAAEAEAAAQSAQQHAAAAAEAAKNAFNAAVEAGKAADRAEEAERKAQQERNRQAAQEASQGKDSGPLTPEEEEALRDACGQQCVDEYKNAQSLVGKDIIDWVIENGGQILLDLIGVTDAKKCFGEGDVEACLWTLVNAGSLLLLIAKLPAVTAAIAKVVGGLGKFLSESRLIRQVLSKGDSIIGDVIKLCNCFPAGTPVAAADGQKPIEDIRVGDQVWARDMTTGQSHLRRVSALFDKHADEILTIGVAGTTLRVTPQHPFWVVGKGWTDAGRLKAGDPLLDRSGVSRPVTAISSATGGAGGFTVYNFEVEGDHNYYITEAQLLVHNCLVFPKHLIPAGHTPNSYGNLVWGVGPAGARAMIGTRTAAQLRELHLTVDGATEWRAFYQKVFDDSVGRGRPNLAAQARVELMDHIISVLRG